MTRPVLNRNLITLLWSLRSLCPLACDYCYFGLVADHQIAPPTKAGQLSHISPNDMSRKAVLAFARTLAGSGVGRVFLAGGEPLAWPGALDVIHVVKAAGIEVVVCTNGLPLAKAEIRNALFDLGVDAISVSLDSTDPAVNDARRPDRFGRGTWHAAVDGIRAVIAQRGTRPGPRVGIYSVLTRHTIDDMPAMGRLTAELGCDYYVPQPVTLTDDHKLHAELSLRPADQPRLKAAFDTLYRDHTSLVLPASTYPQQVLTTVPRTTSPVSSCFGGHTLHFIQPDGAVWDCVSPYRIDATAPSAHRTIHGADAADLFPAPQGSAPGCPLFSHECVNMWPLMDTDRITHPSGSPR
ncbi:radical SAM protein [Kitasatospora sp. NPDC059327]|uniref:radical SAM protein n=1 Tax=Kitasatospora sp. NPDC059327 TaxID=3346803 RepID=UPI0036B44E70